MMKNVLFVTVLVLSFAFSAQALIVENSGFELPGTGKLTNWDDVPGWSSDFTAIDSGVETGWAAPGNGDYSGYLMSGDPSVWQLTSTMIETGEEYTVSVEAQNNWSATPPAILGMIVYYDLMGYRIPVALDFMEVTDSWATYSVTINADDTPSAIGKNLGMELINVGNDSSWIGIDNVQLIPEPATMLLLGIGGLMLRKRK